MLIKLLNLPRKSKILIVLVLDTVLLPLAFWSAIALRLGTLNPDVSSFWWIFYTLPLISVPFFIRMGLYRAVIRYMDDKVVFTVFYSVTLSVLMLTAIIVMFRVTSIPRSSILIYWVTAVAYIAFSRFVARGFMRSLDKRQDRKQNVAIYGAGRAGLQTVLALNSSREYRPVAFFDDSKDLHGTSVAGIRVHSPQNILKVLSNLDCKQLLLAMPSVSRSKKKEIIQSLEGFGIVLKIIPGLGDLVQGTVRIEDIREVGIEDLLGRDPVPPVEELISLCVRGKSVLVTGAGGSIGAELCRQIANVQPEKLILFEQSEYALYKIEMDLKRSHPNLQTVSILGDVLDHKKMEAMMRKYAVSTIYHAAAYKHVPMVEANIVMGVVNNVFGTRATAQAAIAAGVSTFVLVSTDKAVRPTNVMGATKRLAELVLQAMARLKGHTTRFCMVRFGNVLGSSGSVVPLFKEQIKNRGVVTVTHPDVTRYFMTIPEAAQLVLQAGALGSGGDVFVLDMGESVKIVDLAKKIIELSGLTLRDEANPDGDITIEYVGLRPGEKLYEELLIGENVSWTQHPRIMRAEEDFLENDYLEHELGKLRQLCDDEKSLEVKAFLKALVKGYRESE